MFLCSNLVVVIVVVVVVVAGVYPSTCLYLVSRISISCPPFGEKTLQIKYLSRFLDCLDSQNNVVENVLFFANLNQSNFS